MTKRDSVIIDSPPWRWKVVWSLELLKTFLGLHDKTVLQHSPKQAEVDGDISLNIKKKNPEKKNITWLLTADPMQSKSLEAQRSQIDS